MDTKIENSQVSEQGKAKRSFPAILWGAISIGVLVLLIAGVQKVSHSYQAEVEAETKATEQKKQIEQEKERQAAEEKELLTQAVFARYPKLKAFLENVKTGCDEIESANRQIKFTVENAASFYNATIGSHLTDSGDGLKKGRSSIATDEPDCLVPNFKTRLTDLYLSCSGLESSINYFLNYASGSDSTVSARSIVSGREECQNNVEKVRGYLSEDILSLIKPELVETCKADAERQKYLMQHPEVAKKIEQDKQEEAARQAAFAKQAEEESAQKVEAAKQAEITRQAEIAKEEQQRKQEAQDKEDQEWVERTRNELLHVHEPGHSDLIRGLRPVSLHSGDGDIVLEKGTIYRFLRWEGSDQVIVEPWETARNSSLENLRHSLPSGIRLPLSWVTSNYYRRF